MKTLALTVDGDLTYCSVSDDVRGTKGCNHIGHREEGESPRSFSKRMEKNNAAAAVSSNSGFLKSSDGYVFSTNNQTGVIKDKLSSQIHKYFKLGDESPVIKEIKSELSVTDTGDNVETMAATLSWRGKEYNMNLGDVPTQDKHGRISMNGIAFQPLPVVQQYQAGFHRFGNKVVVWENGANPNPIPAFVVHGDGSVHMGANITLPPETVNELLANKGKITPGGLCDSLPDWQKDKLKNIDPVVFDRLGDSPTVADLSSVPKTEVNDLTWRPIKTYEDQIADIMSHTWRSSGTTFRRSVAAGKEPVFYQGTNTENILKDLNSRSNVVLANDLNPIAAAAQEHSISLTGPGGYNSDKAPKSLRDVHESSRGIIDPMEYSSGKNVALTLSLSQSAGIQNIGSSRFLARNSDMDASGKDNILSSTSEYIPFIGHNDPNRIQMATSHLKQAVPISGGEDPTITTPAWEKISGAKLGKNLRVAYVPHPGTFEDSVVMSESAAAAFSTTQNIRYGATLNRGVGEKINAGENIGFDDSGKPIISRYSGIVSSDGRSVETTFPMRVGDKLSGRHGNKSIVGRILPDDQMPTIDGKPSEILMSPLSVTGRMNIGQLNETVSENTTNPSVAIKTETGIERKIEATAGNQFIMRLNHIADKKITDKPARLGEMERILLTSSDDLRSGLGYIVRQDRDRSPQDKFSTILSSMGIRVSES